ncbi:MAG: Ppx/GppA phosphatase family protein [Bacillota bacterium]|jgi:exopolyphosphatase/guanosine-5'-triphosphate,3'-diphosphate pyrophosphatase|nr:Ppx/GppA phosphatase family protein [Bacillota bacterium]NLJ02221.1 Ppx/GppA family phosphatase [Bacillota bacterium]
MERIGIIDLGSNTIRLVIIDIKENGAHHQIESLKESVRLRSGTDAQGYLTAEGIESAVEMVSLFVKFCRARQVKEVIAVATAAVRRAPNRAELIDRIAELTGVTIQVLSSEEEAYLGYLGLINSVTETEGLMADLGGGALKIVGFKDRLNQNSITLDFGAVSLMEAYRLQDLPAGEDLRSMERFLDETFARIPWLPNYPRLIGLGGTFRSLARVYRNHVHYVPDVTDGIIIPAEAVREIYTMLSGMNLEQRRQVPGLEQSRADLSVTGIGIIYRLLKVINGKELMVSASSLRDGIFYKHRYPRDPILFNVLTHHTNNLIDYHSLDENHLRRVSNLAVILFDQLMTLHNLGSYERRLLLLAGLLHELGAVVSVESLEKHTLYTVLNSPLLGLTQRDRVLIAFLAASHNGFFFGSLQDYVEHGPIEPEDIQRIKALAPLLQIAHSLDRSRTGVVTNLQAHVESGLCELKVFGTQKADLEIRDAHRQAGAFQQEYGVELKIVKG